MIQFYNFESEKVTNMLVHLIKVSVTQCGISITLIQTNKQYNRSKIK